MARNGVGVMVRTDGTRTGSTVWVQARNAGVKIVADGQDTHDQDLANEITNSIAADGQTSPSANLPMATYHHTNVGAATARTDYGRVAEIQDGGYVWDATDTGAADAYAIQLSPAIAAYAAGQCFRFIAANANTGASTLAVNGLAAKAIKLPNGSTALAAGDIAAGGLVVVLYDGTNFRLLNAAIGAGTAAAARTQLGLGTMATATATDYLAKAGNLSGLADAATSRTNLGLGTIATQAANNVAITGGTAVLSQATITNILTQVESVIAAGSSVSDAAALADCLCHVVLCDTVTKGVKLGTAATSGKLQILWLYKTGSGGKSYILYPAAGGTINGIAGINVMSSLLFLIGQDGSNWLTFTDPGLVTP